MSVFWTAERVAEVLGAQPRRGAADNAAGSRAAPSYAAFEGIATDTRTLAPGQLFVALRGERFDAHRFLADAGSRGAIGAVVDRGFWEAGGEASAPRGLVYFVVPDTLAALGELGRHRRRSLHARVCAITGTNGKTTTKEMARAALSASFRVHATRGNLNNQVGTPLTLLAAPDDAEALVIEVGTNAPGEIAGLARIVEPDAAVITTVAEGHLEGLSTIRGVLEEKTSLLQGLGRDGIALVGEEPAELVERARELCPAVMVAGLGERADPGLRGTEVHLDDAGRVRFRWLQREVRLRFHGRHNARNALLALGLARAWDVAPEAAIAALESLDPTGLRLEIRDLGALRVVVDCYNANPASLEAAADLLESLPRGGGRVLVLGSMLELGPAAADLHARSARSLAARDVDLLIATGDFVSAFEDLASELGERLHRVTDPMEAADVLKQRLNGDEVVLLKGSRGVALERLLPVLEEIGAEHPAGSAGNTFDGASSAGSH